MSENSSKAYLNYQRGRQKLYPGCCVYYFQTQKNESKKQ